MKIRPKLSAIYDDILKYNAIQLPKTTSIKFVFFFFKLLITYIFLNKSFFLFNRFKSSQKHRPIKNNELGYSSANTFTVDFPRKKSPYELTCKI